jgi:hypothetical protein
MLAFPPFSVRVKFRLAEAGALQLSLFDERDMAAVTSPDYPGERLIVCRNCRRRSESA